MQRAPSMRVLLVHPRFPVTYWGFEHSLPIVGQGATLPPLGLLTLAALLPRTWELRLVDTNLAPLLDDDLLWADAVLVGGMLVQADAALEVVDRAKRKGRLVVVGGPACTSSPERFAAADHVFLGEAEGRIERLVRAIESPGSAPHVLADVPEQRPDVTTSPIPRYDLVDPSRYRAMSVQYSRGCPFRCEFCDIIEMFGRVPRVKTTAQVLAELEALRASGFRGPVFFVDDNFIGNRRAVKQLLPEVARWQRERGLPFTFFTEASVNLASDHELLKRMVEASFDSVFLGIESPSPEALRNAKKTQNASVDLVEAVDTIARAGLDVMGGFIVGFDDDDERAFEAQREFIAASAIPLAMVGMLTALPGTQLARRLAGEGRLRDRTDGDTFTRPNFEPRMGERALLRGYAELLSAVYSTDAYYARCEAALDRIGLDGPRGPILARDVLAATRALLHIGVLGERRRPFFRLLSRAARRGLGALHRAFTYAIQGEHLIRYTAEDVLPRIERALAEVREEREQQTPAPMRRLPLLA